MGENGRRLPAVTHRSEGRQTLKQGFERQLTSASRFAANWIGADPQGKPVVRFPDLSGITDKMKMGLAIQTTSASPLLDVGDLSQFTVAASRPSPRADAAVE
jgi:hypothetical protein